MVTDTNPLIQILRVNIIRFRKEKEWTQARAAEAVDVSLRYYQSLEKGSWPSDKVFQQLCEAFEVEARELLSVENMGLATETVRLIESIVILKERHDLRELLRIASKLSDRQLGTLKGQAESFLRVQSQSSSQRVRRAK
jgi:transcriptional regulator with XRE-family HTH domain